MVSLSQMKQLKVYKHRGVGLSWLMYDSTTMPNSTSLMYDSTTLSCFNVLCHGLHGRKGGGQRNALEYCCTVEMWHRLHCRNVTSLWNGVQYNYTPTVQAKHPVPSRYMVLLTFLKILCVLWIALHCIAVTRWTGGTDTSDYDISPKIRGLSTYLWFCCWYLRYLCHKPGCFWRWLMSYFRNMPQKWGQRGGYEQHFP